MSTSNLVIVFIVFELLLVIHWLIFISESRTERVILSMSGIVLSVAGVVAVLLP